jgi:hypothetical protein
MFRGLGGSQMQRAGRCFAGPENRLLLKVCVDRRTVKQDPRARAHPALAFHFRVRAMLQHCHPEWHRDPAAAGGHKDLAQTFEARFLASTVGMTAFGLGRNGLP